MYLKTVSKFLISIYNDFYAIYIYSIFAFFFNFINFSRLFIYIKRKKLFINCLIFKLTQKINTEKIPKTQSITIKHPHNGGTTHHNSTSHFHSNFFICIFHTSTNPSFLTQPLFPLYHHHSTTPLPLLPPSQHNSSFPLPLSQHNPSPLLDTHFSDLVFNIFWLVAHRNFSYPRKVYKGQGDNLW